MLCAQNGSETQTKKSAELQPLSPDRSNTNSTALHLKNM